MWFKVDDQLAFHPKVMQAGNAAMGLWVRAGSWSAAHLSGGHVPRDVARALGGSPRVARKLVRAGLWTPASDGWTFDDDGLWDIVAGPRKGRIRDTIRDLVYARDGWACVACKATDDLTLDHIWPRSLGGSDDQKNLQTMCRSCNSSKGARV